MAAVSRGQGGSEIGFADLSCTQNRRRKPNEKGRPHVATAPNFVRSGPVPDQAAVLIFSIATATRFETGCAASPASLMNASVFFEVSATIESNAVRT